jgi:hypothetical protein
MSLLLLRSEQPAYHCTLCLTGRKWLQSGVHLRRPDQVVKRDSGSPERLSAFARPRPYCTSRGSPPFSFAGVAPRASKVVKQKKKQLQKSMPAVALETAHEQYKFSAAGAPSVWSSRAAVCRSRKLPLTPDSAAVRVPIQRNKRKPMPVSGMGLVIEAGNSDQQDRGASSEHSPRITSQQSGNQIACG